MIVDKSQIKFELNLNTEKKTNMYVVEVECDSNDGDYMNAELDVPVNAMTELDILLIAYLNLDRWSVPKNWTDAQERLENKYYRAAFGRQFVCENNEFGNIDDYYHTSWLTNYVTESRELLLFCGAVDDYCHSFVGINVTYYDKDGNKYDCTEPDLGKLFDSEKDFVDYVKALDNNGTYDLPEWDMMWCEDNDEEDDNDD